MPQRTIANGGGNWNSTSTWVEGAVPTSSDFIVATATSGQLTVNVSATIQYFDLSLYTNTLTINNSITLTTGLASSTSTIGSGMSFNFLGATQGRIVLGNVAQTFTQNGTTPIPFLTTGSAIITLTNNIYVNNHIGSSGGINGNTIFIYNSIDYSFATLSGTSIRRFVGNGTINILAMGSGTEFIIDCSGGTATISSNGLGLGGSIATSATNIFRHLSGTIVNPTFRPQLAASSGVYTLDLLSGTTWDFYCIITSTPSTINLLKTSSFDKFELFTNTPVATLNVILSGSTYNLNELNMYNGLSNQGGSYYRAGLDLSIATATTLNISSFIDINGGSNEPNPTQTPNLEIKSNTPGTQANLNINTWEQYISRARFTDINCSGGNTLYGQNLTLSNTSNITQYTLPPTSSGGGGSFTFVN